MKVSSFQILLLQNSEEQSGENHGGNLFHLMFQISLSVHIQMALDDFNHPMRWKMVRSSLSLAHTTHEHHGSNRDCGRNDKYNRHDDGNGTAGV